MSDNDTVRDGRKKDGVLTDTGILSAEFGQSSGLGGFFDMILAFFGMIFGGEQAMPKEVRELFETRNRQDSLVFRGRTSATGASIDAERGIQEQIFVPSETFPDDISFNRAERQGNNVVYYAANGDVVIKHRRNTTEATRSWVNNNPGNIEYGEFARRQGAIGTDGRFAIFASVEAGFKAQVSLLQSRNYRNLTLAQAISRYAPPSENDTGKYISYVEQNAGVGRNTRLSDLSQDQLTRVAQVMSRKEGWKAGEVIAQTDSPERAAAIGQQMGGRKTTQVDDEGNRVLIASAAKPPAATPS